MDLGSLVKPVRVTEMYGLCAAGPAVRGDAAMLQSLVQEPF